jgi:lipid A 3-O-deacylase
MRANGRAMRLALALALMACALAAPGRSQAQAFATWEVGTDNDAYDFWVPASRRPDHDYTHGMWLAAELNRAPLWGRHLGSGVPACTGRETAAERCLTTRIELGQKLYTPVVDAPDPRPGERAYAGWLYLSATGRREGARTRTTGTVELGVTGPESLGRAVHEEFHRVAGFWMPAGWRNQLSFEPAVSLRLGREVLAYQAMHGAGRVATVVPDASVAVGNLRTDAQLGVHARVGRGVPHPWRAAPPGAPSHLSAYATAGVRGDWVLHDLLLDGNTFAPSVRVRRRPLVGQLEAGLGVRWRNVGAEFRSTRRSREYRTQATPHTWSTIALTLERER